MDMLPALQSNYSAPKVFIIGEIRLYNSGYLDLAVVIGFTYTGSEHEP